MPSAGFKVLLMISPRNRPGRVSPAKRAVSAQRDRAGTAPEIMAKVTRAVTGLRLTRWDSAEFARRRAIIGANLLALVTQLSRSKASIADRPPH